MTTQESNALRLADALAVYLPKPQDMIDAAAELRRLHTLIAACEPYLKEGETPAERIERDHRDSLALMTLLAREKTKNEALLEALKWIADVNATDYEYQTKARAAIAKAEGEKT